MAESVTRATAKAEGGAKKKAVVVVGFDDSEQSIYALEWTLNHFFSDVYGGPSVSPFKLVVIHSKPSPSSVINLASPGAAGMIPFVDSDLRKIAVKVLEKAKDICIARSVSVLAEVAEGDARNVLCDAAEKHHADILVLGSHGHGTIKRAFLGSVCDYCAHHAHCSVMIVKKPKAKH